MCESGFTVYRKHCPVCGKEFYASGEWVYRKGYAHNLRIYCSWRCMRQEEKAHMTIGDKINQAIRDGLNDDEIRKLLGVTQRQIDFRKERKI